MKFNLAAITSLLIGIFLLAGVAAFFLYVPPLTIISVMTIVAAMALMFALGVQAGGRRFRRHSARKLNAA